MEDSSPFMVKRQFKSSSSSVSSSQDQIVVDMKKGHWVSQPAQQLRLKCVGQDCRQIPISCCRCSPGYTFCQEHYKEHLKQPQSLVGVNHWKLTIQEAQNHFGMEFLMREEEKQVRELNVRTGQLNLVRIFQEEKYRNSVGIIDNREGRNQMGLAPYQRANLEKPINLPSLRQGIIQNKLEEIKQNHVGGQKSIKKQKLKIHTPKILKKNSGSQSSQSSSYSQHSPIKRSRLSNFHITQEKEKVTQYFTVQLPQQNRRNSAQNIQNPLLYIQRKENRQKSNIVQISRESIIYEQAIKLLQMEGLIQTKKWEKNWFQKLSCCFFSGTPQLEAHQKQDLDRIYKLGETLFTTQKQLHTLLLDALFLKLDLNESNHFLSLDCTVESFLKKKGSVLALLGFLYMTEKQPQKTNEIYTASQYNQNSKLLVILARCVQILLRLMTPKIIGSIIIDKQNAADTILQFYSCLVFAWFVWFDSMQPGWDQIESIYKYVENSARSNPKYLMGKKND